MSVLTSERPRLSQFRQAAMALYWFATNVHWGAILAITLPAQATILGGEANKGTTLGAILLSGAFVSMIVAPVAGALSDRWVTRFGRRRPWIVVGTLMNIPGLIALAKFAEPGGTVSLPLYIAAFVWVEFWNNVATAPFSALVPDVVPPEQRGSASGWVGLMTMLGLLVGAASAFVFTTGDVTDLTAVYYFIAVVMFLGMVGTVVSVREPVVKVDLPPFDLRTFARDLFIPFRNLDFRWVFLTRLLMEMGAFTVQEFVQFYLKDVVRDFHLSWLPAPGNPEVATSYFLGALLVGGVVASLGAGVVSDRVGRKPIVYLSSALQAVVVVVLAFFYDFQLAIIVGVVFGLGYGAYTAVDWALATDVLPSDADHAKDMGVWHVALTLPQVIATPFAGLMLDKFQVVGQANGLPVLGYQVVFLLATVYFILGTVLVAKIKKVR